MADVTAAGPLKASNSDATTDIRRFLIIVNPTAGRRRSRELAEALHERLVGAGACCAIEITAARGDGERIAAAALAEQHPGPPGRLCVVACSGDGTVQEVVNALMTHAEVPATLGLAPGGRCNDFATTLGVPDQVDDIAAALLAQHTRRVDVGRIGSRFFCTIATLGFDAAVTRYVNDSALPVSGTPAYVLGTLRVLLTFKAVGVRLSHDGGALEEDLFLVASANTSSYGGQLQIAPEADMTDGLLEVCVVPRISRIRGLLLLRAVFRGRHKDMEGVRFIKTRSLAIDTPRPLEIWADGEFMTRTPATIDIVPQALEVVVP